VSDRDDLVAALRRQRRSGEILDCIGFLLWLLALAAAFLVGQSHGYRCALEDVQESTPLHASGEQE
jgi:hypothetical protein